MSYFTQGVTNVASGQYNLLVTDLSNYGAGMYFGGTKDTSGNITGQYGYMTATKANGVVVDGSNNKVLIQNTAGSLSLDTAGKFTVSGVKFSGLAGDTSANNVFLTADKDGKLIRDYTLYNQYNAFNASISGRVRANEIDISNNLKTLRDTSAILVDLSNNYYTFKAATTNTLTSLSGRMLATETVANTAFENTTKITQNMAAQNELIQTLTSKVQLASTAGSLQDILSQHAQAINDMAYMINGLNMTKPINISGQEVENQNTTIALRGTNRSGNQTAVNDYVNYSQPAAPYDVSGVYLTQDSSGYVYIVHPKNLNLVAPGTVADYVDISDGNFLTNAVADDTTSSNVFAKLPTQIDDKPTQMIASRDRYRETHMFTVHLYNASSMAWTSETTWTDTSGEANMLYTFPRNSQSTPSSSMTIAKQRDNSNNIVTFGPSKPQWDTQFPSNRYDVYKSTTPVATTTTLFYQAYRDMGDYSVLFKNVSMSFSNPLTNLTGITVAPSTKSIYFGLSSTAIYKKDFVTKVTVTLTDNGNRAKTTPDIFLVSQGGYENVGEDPYSPYGSSIGNPLFTLDTYQNSWIPDSYLLIRNDLILDSRPIIKVVGSVWIYDPNTGSITEDPNQKINFTLTPSTNGYTTTAGVFVDYFAIAYI
jgi:hypothetical protein